MRKVVVGIILGLFLVFPHASNADNIGVLAADGIAPQINGADMYGVWPGTPFLYTIAATGDRPMWFSAKGLPIGLSLDKNTGIITGNVTKSGQGARLK